MKIANTLNRPRTPWLVAAMFRRAGSHRPGGPSMRQQAGRALRRELKEMKHIP